MLLFADDVVLLATSQRGLAESFHHFAAFCVTWSLTISRAKTKVMIFRGPELATV